jgi:hypothetical protein
MWKHSVIKFFLFTVMSFLAIAFLNWIVNPYDLWNGPALKGFNLAKPEQDTHDRQYKTTKLRLLKPTTVFLGTSRTEKGIDPNNKNIMMHAYNCAISGGRPDEYEVFFNIAKQLGVKEIIIGTDFFAFYAKEVVNKNDFIIAQPLKYIISTDVLMSSIKSILSKKPTTFLESGRMDPLFIQTAYSSSDKKQNFQSSETWYRQGLYGALFLKNQEKHWQAFERILDTAHRNNIQITLFISPCHARQWEVLDSSLGYDMFETFKRRLTKVNEQSAYINHKQPYPVWDFSDYNKLTTEEIPKGNTEMKWFWDSAHYKKELGDIILDRMFDGNFSGGQDYPDFGVKLTSQNIEAHLLKLRNEREQWRLTHPQDVKEIEALKTTKSK